jgi:hypothetical protein
MPAALRSSIVTLVLTVMMVGFVAAAPAGAQVTTAPPTSVATAVTSDPSPGSQSAGDTESSRTVNRIVLALLAMAALLLVLLVWLWRTTKPAASHLDGLDAMGSRRWRNSSSERRAVILAPVHERRGEIRDEELIAPTEPEQPEPEPEPEPELLGEEPAGEELEQMVEPVVAESGEAQGVDEQEPSAPLM